MNFCVTSTFRKRYLGHLIDLTDGIRTYLYHYVSKIILCPLYAELGVVRSQNSDFFSALDALFPYPSFITYSSVNNWMFRSRWGYP
jgi:hypothetical protein